MSMLILMETTAILLQERNTVLRVEKESTIEDKTTKQGTNYTIKPIIK